MGDFGPIPPGNDAGEGYPRPPVVPLLDFAAINGKRERGDDPMLSAAIEAFVDNQGKPGYVPPSNPAPYHHIKSGWLSTKIESTVDRYFQTNALAAVSPCKTMAPWESPIRAPPPSMRGGDSVKIVERALQRAKETGSRTRSQSTGALPRENIGEGFAPCPSCSICLDAEK